MVGDVLTRDVFVAGGTPEVTYNPRTERQIENEVAEFLQQSGKALSVSGPTKCGKTVLIQRLLPVDRAIWIQGADITGPEDIWRRIVDYLGLWDTVELTTEATSNTATGGTGGLNVGVLQLSARGDYTAGSSQGQRFSRTRSLGDVAREALATLAIPIVVDDFHFVPQGVRLAIARTIKTIIPTCPVVLIAVPYDAFQAVLSEPDLGGRVWTLSLEPWSEEELRAIAVAGFGALNLQDEDDSVSRACAEQSYGSPFIMQQLCFDVCINQTVLTRESESKKICVPEDWRQFLGRIARRTKPPIFQRLLDGARTRGTERLMRTFVEDDVKLDVYGCILRGIQMLGPKTVTTLTELRRCLDTAVRPAPTGQQIGSSLAQMHLIAEGVRGAGDSAFVYKDERAHVVDPFLLFYLRHGDWVDSA